MGKKNKSKKQKKAKEESIYSDRPTEVCQETQITPQKSAESNAGLSVEDFEDLTTEEENVTIMQPQCSDVYALWIGSASENHCNYIGIPHELINADPKAQKATELAREIATMHRTEAEQKFADGYYQAAYVEYLEALKILTKHGDIRHAFGMDSGKIRECQDKCALCLFMIAMENSDKEALKRCLLSYEMLVEKDPTHPVWYKRRAIVNFHSEKYIDAYKDMMVHMALLKEYNTIPKDIDRQAVMRFYSYAAETAWQDEKKNLKARKPFITSDWIDLWALCPCNDVLLEDLLSVRAEVKDPRNKCPLLESAYKEALKQMSEGYHTMVVDTLENAYKFLEGKYRAEAFLLLTLIYSPDSVIKANQYLDIFIKLWEEDQHQVPLRRRKQIFMRYMSLARSLLVFPFQNLNLSMFSAKERSQFCLQTALAIILRLQVLEGYPQWITAIDKGNIRKLDNIKYFCDEAIKADRKSLYARMLTKYVMLEIAIAKEPMNEENHEKIVEKFIDYNNVLQARFQEGHHQFSSWCLCAANFATTDYYAALTCGEDLEDDLLFPGFIRDYVIRHQVHLNNYDRETLKCAVEHIETMLSEDPENFRLFLTAADFYYRLNNIEEASSCANSAIYCWPGHIIQGQVQQLVRSALLLEARAEADAKVKNIQILNKLELESVELPTDLGYVRKPGDNAEMDEKESDAPKETNTEISKSESVTEIVRTIVDIVDAYKRGNERSISEEK